MDQDLRATLVADRWNVQESLGTQQRCFRCAEVVGYSFSGARRIGRDQIKRGTNLQCREWILCFPSSPFSQVSQQLKQRTYEWRGGFVLSAAAAVNAFWETDPIYADPINHSAYIEWGIPTDIDEPTPITWANVDESDPDNIVRLKFISCKPPNSYHYRFTKVLSYRRPSLPRLPITSLYSTLFPSKTGFQNMLKEPLHYLQRR